MKKAEVITKCVMLAVLSAILLMVVLKNTKKKNVETFLINPYSSLSGGGGKGNSIRFKTGAATLLNKLSLQMGGQVKASMIDTVKSTYTDSNYKPRLSWKNNKRWSGTELKKPGANVNYLTNHPKWTYAPPDSADSLRVWAGSKDENLVKVIEGQVDKQVKIIHTNRTTNTNSLSFTVILSDNKFKDIQNFHYHADTKLYTIFAKGRRDGNNRIYLFERTDKDKIIKYTTWDNKIQFEKISDLYYTPHQNLVILYKTS